MKIEKQVCNIKSSKKLEKLGIKQDSFFYWYKLKGKWILFRGIDLGLPEFKSEKGEKIYSAFTPAELGRSCQVELIIKMWFLARLVRIMKFIYTGKTKI